MSLFVARASDSPAQEAASELPGGPAMTAEEAAASRDDESLRALLAESLGDWAQEREGGGDEDGEGGWDESEDEGSERAASSSGETGEAARTGGGEAQDPGAAGAGLAPEEAASPPPAAAAAASTQAGRRPFASAGQKTPTFAEAAEAAARREAARGFGQGALSNSLGASFQPLVDVYSQVPTQGTGGRLLGWSPRGQVAPEAEVVR